jgi:hypothetical protein
LKQGDALSPLFLNFSFECVIRRVQVNQESWRLNNTHQFPVQADDVNILGGSVHATIRNTEALLGGCRENGLAVSTKKTKYMVMP